MRIRPVLILITIVLLAVTDGFAFTWGPRADLGGGAFGFGRGFHGAGTINNRIYVAGGGFIGSLLWGSDSTGQVYDPVTDMWTNLPSFMAKKRAAPASTVAQFGGQDRLYVIGGMDLTDFPTDQFTHSDIEEYDPVAGTWRTVAACVNSPDDCLPDGGRTWGSCAVTVDNQIYIMGGASSNLGSMSARLASYDPDTDTFTSLADMPLRVSDGSCAVVGRNIYWFGGWDELGGWGANPSPDTHIYDVDTNTWTTAASSSPTPRANAAAIAVSGTVYLVGGWDGTGTYSGLFNSVDAYDPSTDIWAGDFGDPIGCIEDSPAEGFRGRSGLTLHVANDGANDLLFAVGGNVGLSLPTRCNEASPLVADTDPPVFGGLTAAFEQTACPDPSAPMVHLEWVLATDASPPVTYNVYRGTTPFFVPDAGSRVAAGVTGTSHLDALTPAQCGSTFFYLARAQDSASPPNEDTNDVRIPVDILCPPPPVPSNVGNNLFVGKDPSGNPVLDWTGYTPSPDVTHYHVYRTVLCNTMGSILYEPTVRTQTDTFATGAIYCYDVRSASDCLNQESAD